MTEAQLALLIPAVLLAFAGVMLIAMPGGAEANRRRWLGLVLLALAACLFAFYAWPHIFGALGRLA